MRGSLHDALVWTHRWVGLTLGSVLTVICVSGSALLFQTHVWEWAHGHLTPSEMSSTIGSIDRWIEEGHKEVPDLGFPVAVWAPGVEHNLSRAGMLIFGGRPPGGLGQMGLVAVLVAPDTGRVLGVVDVDRSPAYAPIFLHRDLWRGATGRVVSGVTAVASLILLAIGLYLWWPPMGRVGRKLAGQPWRATLRKARPLHDWVGVWTLAMLILLVFSGLTLVQPAWTDPLITAATGPEPAPRSGQEARPGTAACNQAISIDGGIARSLALVPSSRFSGLYPADARKGQWEVIVAPAHAQVRHLETHVALDVRCGRVAIEATPATRAADEALKLWLSDLHDGAALGAAGPAVVSLFGLAPVVLLWSGIVMWLNGRRRRTQRP